MGNPVEYGISRKEGGSQGYATCEYQCGIYESPPPPPPFFLPPRHTPALPTGADTDVPILKLHRWRSNRDPPAPIHKPTVRDDDADGGNFTQRRRLPALAPDPSDRNSNGGGWRDNTASGVPRHDMLSSPGISVVLSDRGRQPRKPSSR